MANIGHVQVINIRLHDFGQGLKSSAECTILYAPTGFELMGEFVEIGTAGTVASINNIVQQFGMDKINTEVPGAITNLNDVWLWGGRAR